MVLKAFKRKLAGIYRRSIIEPQLLSALEREKLLERDWYLQENPDVAASKVSADLHFIRFGILEGRLPNRYFDAKNVAEQIENSSPKLARFLRDNLGSFPSSSRNVTLNDFSHFSIYDPLQHPKVDVVLLIN